MSDRDGDPARRPPDEAELSQRLRNLGRRLDAERREVDERDARENVPVARPNYALALRLGADFVAGIVLGAAIGWGIDRLFGIAPWGLIVFLLLGFAAGILSLLRTAGLVKPGPSGIDDPGDRL